LISGLSRGVLVVEGSKDSGTLITVKYAAEQGKDVFAPPAPIMSKMSEAPNLLLKEGAKLVTSSEDIFQEIGLMVAPKRKTDIVNSLTEEEREIFDFICRESRIIDEIVLMTKKPIDQVLKIISILEIKGAIEKDNEKRYRVSQ
jgi:DNA processing protein